MNQAGIDLIKSFEGCKLKAYKDLAGIWTIGYGHTGPDSVPGRSISQVEADELLLCDLSQFETSVRRLVKVPVTDNQLAALVSFAYNLGSNSLAQSTLLRCLNRGNYQDAAAEFEKWSKAGGVVVAGLLRRRKAERALFEAS